MCKTSWGLQYKYARQLFTAVAAPRLDYGAIIWYRPQRNSSGSLSEVVTAQRMAMKAILGCFRTVPTAAMEIESALLPTHLRLQSKIVRTFIRFQALPQHHPVAKVLKSAVRSTKSTFITTLEHLARMFPQHVKQMEEIHPYVRPPWWEPRHSIILDSKRDPKQRHEVPPQNTNTLRIYTDGSGHRGYIGSAAYCETTQATTKQHLGAETDLNVYTGELNAIDLAVDIARAVQFPHTNCEIYADSKAAITATVKPWRQSGQSFITKILDNIDNLIGEQGPEYKITITWVPGHSGIKGNETADMAAKEAAAEPAQQALYKSLRSSCIQFAKRTVEKEWDASWKSNTTQGNHLKRITTARHTASVLKLSKSLKTRQQVSRLVSMRTGHCSLNRYLHRFHVDNTDTPLCECGSGREETVSHFLLDCARYDQQRAQLAKKVGIGGMRMEKLLGYPKLIPHTLEFVENTKRMPF